MQIYQPRLNRKTLATATLIFHIRVVELETLIQAFLGEIQLGTIDISQALWINNHFDPVTLKRQVLGMGFIDEFQCVSHAGAAGGFDAQAQPQPLATIGKEFLYAVCCGLCKRNSHGNFKQLLQQAFAWLSSQPRRP